MSSLYIHIPFCKSKCHYCAFNSYSGLEDVFDRYQQALISELRQQIEQNRENVGSLKTIFFGGGTPTLIGAGRITELLRVIKDNVILSDSCEISVEANPETVDLNHLCQLRDGGVNRLSFGVQSFEEADLKILGRAHSVERAVGALSEAKKAGFTNINLDLMSGLPNQSRDDWKCILEQAMLCEPTHLSIYQLTPEENTPFYNQVMAGELCLPDGDYSFSLDEVTLELCIKNGYAQYEISNYAMAGFECAHNINYWENREYLSAGAGAVSYMNGCRERRTESPIEYCEKIKKGEDVIIESEKLCKEESFRETVMIGLRMVKGVSVTHLRSRFGIDLQSYYGESLTNLFEEKLLILDGDHLKITDKGRPLSNQIMSILV